MKSRKEVETLHRREFDFKCLCFALEKFFECKKSVEN